MQDVHFRLDISTLSQAVQKGITSNVSDIYAMGGTPSSVAFTAGLPPGCGYDEIGGIVDGLRKGCRAYGITLCGGDTVSSPMGYFFNIAIVGSVPRGGAVMRSGAREGDRLVLFGEIGGSLAGLRILEMSLGERTDGEPLSRLLPAGDAARGRFLRAARRLSTGAGPGEFTGLCAEEGIDEKYSAALSLAATHLVPFASRPGWLLDAEGIVNVSAMIDISDGLARDLASLCAESGRGAIVREDRLPAPDALGDFEDRRLVRELVISSGEEYCLLAAVRGTGEKDLPSGASAIGEIASSGTGLVLMDAAGATSPFPRCGYEHIFNGSSVKRGR